MLRKIVLFTFLAALLISIAAAAPPQQSGSSYDALRREAEREYSEKSFSRAHALYESAAKLDLDPGERRWVELRLADTAWRADAASPDPDTSKLQAWIETLRKLAEQKPPDFLSAEAAESLGDLWSTHRQRHNQYEGARFYAIALDFWAGVEADDLDVARRRYLNIVFRMAEGAIWSTPREVLVNAIQIATTREDRIRARFYLAQHYLHQRTPENVERAQELFEEILAEGKSEWTDDALYLAATSTQDYARALELLRRLLRDYQPGQSRYVDDAQRTIAAITKPSLDVMVHRTFVPDSEQQFMLSWRNVKTVDLALHPIDLTTAMPLPNDREWQDAIPLEGTTVARRWTIDTRDSGEHKPGQEALRMNPRVAPGAYIVVARGGGITARALFLVTDAHVITHAAGDRLHVFVTSVETGEPIANARVRVASGMAKNDGTAQTNANGVAEFPIRDNGRLLVTANGGNGRQAYHDTYTHSWQPRTGTAPQWRVYAFTDRPAYRPNESVQWKIIARIRENERWVTPANTPLPYEIVDPRGQKVAGGTAQLNAFGSFWSELPLTPSMPLGMYTIRFLSKDRHHDSSAELFRLEEYKLPEFTVTVNTPEGKQYRLGDTIEATVDAQYYFGGPVANAEVEVVVHRQPFHRYWFPWREHDWYFEKSTYPYEDETLVSQQTLRTDANGRAIVRIDTQRDGTDVSYRIEARVVDASRREVRGEGTVRVTRQRYTVLAQPEHYLHRPGDRVSVRFRAIDANDRPVQTTGTIEVIRRRWIERLYEEEVIETSKLTTDANGEAEFAFTPRNTGYYIVRWTSVDGDAHRARDRVIAETTIWVADRATTDLGYRHESGIDVIVDKEMLRAGETATVLLVAQNGPRWVLVTTTGDSILDTQVVKMDGTAKVVQIPIDDRHVPNFFVTATSVFARELSTETERLVVPPVEHFLDVEVKADRAEYEPRQEGTLTITTRDANGKPVPAEVAVSVSDEAVTAIQSDVAGDPRQFFFADVRGEVMQASGSVHSQSYVKLGKDDLIVDGPELQGRHGYPGGAMAGNAAGAVAESITVTSTDMAAPQMRKSSAPPPPPAPAPVMAPPPAEPAMEITVRSDFRSTAFWKPDVVTDANGSGTVRFKFPEALTTWRATARAATAGSEFGMASSTARTNLPLLVRLQAPRFFVVGDRVTVSGVINNNTGAPVSVTPQLEVEGLTLADRAAPLTVPAHGDARADWTVLAERAGTAKLRVTARGAQFGDAMERELIVFEHGIDKLIARSGKMRGGETQIQLELPRERRSTGLLVNVTPSLAATLFDALPYLLEFPYGCTEQTMSRFLPAAVLARTTGKKPANLDAVVASGMARLYDMQHENGAWGWWKEGPDDDWMTAYAVWGFAIARDAGLNVRADAVNRAAAWLERRLVERGDPNHTAWMLHALSAWRGGKPSPAERRAFDATYATRERLSAYGRALFALTAHRHGDTERARLLVRNLEDGAKIERGDAAESLGTAHWGADRFWWRWHEGPVETTAFVLQALITIEPKHRLIEPAMNWLVRNRRGRQWTNTRDTAIALLALNDYLEISGELESNATYEVSVNGRVIGTGSDEKSFRVDPSILTDTTQDIRIRRTSGDGPLYFATEARFFSLEEPVKAAGNELFVKREYFRLVPRPTLLKGINFSRVALRDGESVKSGDRIEVLVSIDVKNDYEYLIFEDLKPAGFEAVELQSGQPLYASSPNTSRSAWVYQELRDRHVAMFIDHLQQGQWQIRYTLRAEAPGTFHALPLIGQAMYVPDIRGNSDEARVTVTER